MFHIFFSSIAKDFLTYSNENGFLFGHEDASSFLNQLVLNIWLHVIQNSFFNFFAFSDFVFNFCSRSCPNELFTSLVFHWVLTPTRILSIDYSISDSRVGGFCARNLGYTSYVFDSFVCYFVNKNIWSDYIRWFAYMEVKKLNLIKSKIRYQSV